DAGFTLLEMDITDTVPDLEVDALFHLASAASPEGYGRHPIETLLTNSAGTHRLLELATERHARFLMASTSEIYGDPQVHPQPETYWGNVNPIGPRPAMTKASGSARRSPLLMSSKRSSTGGSSASSTPMV